MWTQILLLLGTSWRHSSLTYMMLELMKEQVHLLHKVNINLYFKTVLIKFVLFRKSVKGILFEGKIFKNYLASIFCWYISHIVASRLMLCQSSSSGTTSHTNNCLQSVNKSKINIIRVLEVWSWLIYSLRSKMQISKMQITGENRLQLTASNQGFSQEENFLN